jgi:2-haloacid dehalogenase
VTVPAVVVFDVNETLVDLQPLRARFEEVGAPGHLLEPWFAGTLRDGIALTAAGAYADFPTVATGVLQGILARCEGLRGGVRESAERIVLGLAELPLHPDVEAGMRSLQAAGVRLVTLTNGSAELTERLLARSCVSGLVERRLSVSEVGRWKPAPEPYLFAAKVCGARPGQLALVAVHPWDVNGAKRAGLRGAWLNRGGDPYPGYFEPPDFSASALPALAEALLSSV